MKKIILFTIALLAVLTGCARYPIPIALSHPTNYQLKMQSAQHWEVLAEDVAQRIKTSLKATFPNAVVKPSIFIRYTKEYEKVPFGKAFYHLLRSKLVQKGTVVLNDMGYKDTLLLDYDMQVVQHKDRRTTYPIPGMLTALGAGVWLVSQADKHWANPGLAAAPFVVGADVLASSSRYFPGETDTEVVINTTMTLRQQFIFGDSRIYYINDGDFDHYENDSKNFAVVGCAERSTCPAGQ